MSDRDFTVTQLGDTVGSLRRAALSFWVIGGWGIDALVGRETRPHHDLDVLVAVQQLPRLAEWLDAEGFARAFEWEENVPVTVAGQVRDTAFVARHADGRELDVHSVVLDENPAQIVGNPPWPFPAEWTAAGTIDGIAIPCVTAAVQRDMHRGYELPAKHHADLALIAEL